MPRRLIALAMTMIAPLLIAASDSYTHSGQVAPRTGPELSDFALFGVAAVGVWFARRALRARFRRHREDPPVPRGD